MRISTENHRKSGLTNQLNVVGLVRVLIIKNSLPQMSYCSWRDGSILCGLFLAWEQTLVTLAFVLQWSSAYVQVEHKESS